MTNLEIIVLICVIFSLYIFGLYIDKQYNLRVIDWFNGKSATPFSKTKENPVVKTEQADKVEEIKILKARIEVLERIVTEPAFELNQKLNALK
jgi:hypothetical protein